jgi:hypothetical protein
VIVQVGCVINLFVHDFCVLCILAFLLQCCATVEKTDNFLDISFLLLG